LEYQVGVYYLTARIYENATLAADLGMPAPPPPYIAILGLDATDIGHFESAAAFGQATYHVTNKLRFLAGARFTHDYVDNVTYSYPYPTLALVFPVGTIPKASVKTNNVSWRGSVQYDFTADVMGYVTVAHGYKGPGFNQFSALAVPPELSYLYEAGVKTRLFDNRASFSLAAFDEIFDHFQDQTFFPVAPFYAVLSAGRLDSRGFEAQVDARLTEELTISANVAYADAYFGSFPGDQCYTGEPAEGSPARNVCFQGHSDSTGNTLANSPRWSGTLAARYVHPLSNGLQLEAGGNLYFRSLVNYASDGNPNTIQGGFALLGLNLGVGAPDGDWQVTLFCRNCTDKRFVSYIEPYPLLSTDYGQQFGADSFRTVGVTFRKSF
jgi:iron complex outermembrane receptor protein